MNRVFETFKKHPATTAGLTWVLLLVLFYWQVLFAGNVFAFVDASRFFYPVWKWGAAVLHHGLIPLWNPDAQFGTPYLADPQMACAYPPVFFLYSRLNPIDAFSALILFHHFWAIAGTWLLARGQGISARTSFWGSLAFGFSLHLICSSWTPVALMAISWVPWVLFSAERLYQGKKGGLLFLSFTWAMQLSAGYPVLTYLTGLALVCHWGWKSLKTLFRKEKVSVNWIGWMGLAAGLATLYNLVWGLPFLEFFQNSNYQNGSNHFQDLTWSNLATILNPFFLGHPLSGNYQGPHYWVATYFVGLPTLCLLAWGLVNRAFQKNTPWLLLLFLVLSTGSTLKLGGWLKPVLPGYALVIHSGFWISLVVLWAVLLAMEALEILIEPPKMTGETLSWVLTVAAVYGTAYWFKNEYFSPFFWPSLLFALTAVWFKEKGFQWLMILGALVLSLGPAAYSVNMTMDRIYDEKPPSVLSRLKDPGRLFFSPVLLSGAVKLQGQSMEDAYNHAKQNCYPNWPLAYGREEVPIYNTLQLADSFAWTFQVFQHSLTESRKAIDYLGIRYVFGPSRFEDLTEVPPRYARIKVFENPTPFSLWFTLSKAVAAGPTPNEDFTKADQENMDYRYVGFIDNPAQAGNYQKRQVVEVGRTSNSVILSAVGRGRALLASSETGAPGWKVWVNGQSKPVEKINDAFRGVVLNDGEDNAVFKYEPFSFRLGLFFALLVCGFWVWMLLRQIKKT